MTRLNNVYDIVHTLADIERRINTIHDFPKTGVNFLDLNPVFLDYEMLKSMLIYMGIAYPQRFDVVGGIEARGMPLAMAYALKYSSGYFPIRKVGKLPPPVLTMSYALEYGTDTIQIATDAVASHDSVLIVDDVLATGGTLEAAIKLVASRNPSIIKCLTVLEITKLEGRERIKANFPDVEICSLIKV